MEREKSAGPERKTSTDSKEATFVIWKNHARAPYTKERLSPTSKARREASRIKFVKKGEVPDRVETFGKVYSSKNRPRARLRFVKPIRNGLTKIENLIKSGRSRAEASPARREN